MLRNGFSQVSLRTYKVFGVVWPPPGPWIPLALPGSPSGLETKEPYGDGPYRALKKSYTSKLLLALESLASEAPSLDELFEDSWRAF